MLQKENLDTMEVGELVSEIRAHEMGILFYVRRANNKQVNRSQNQGKQAPQAQDDQARIKLKQWRKDHHESSSDDEEDGELALMMRKFTRLSDKINKKGYNFDPKENVPAMGRC